MVSGVNSYLYSNGIYSRNIYNNYNRGAVSAIDRLQKLNRYETKNNYYTNYATRTLNQSAQQFLKTYQSDYQQLKQAAGALDQYTPNNVWNNIIATNDDTEVAQIQNHYSSQVKGRYSLEVKQLAQAQRNTSTALNSNETAALDKGYLEIISGGNRHMVTVDGAGKTNQELLETMAKDINSQKMGLTASVVSQNGQSQLVLAGDKTGYGHDFTVSGSQEVLQQTGLHNVKQTAQDAQYTFNGQERHSQTNDVALDSYRVSATLKSVGQTTIDFATDSDTVKKAVNKLVEAHNNTLKTLNDNVQMGTAVTNQLKNLTRPPIAEESMKALGLSYQKDGKLGFDEKTFAQAYAQDASNVKNLLGGSYSVARGLLDDAQKALSQPSYKLVDGVNAQKSFDEYFKQQIEENPFRLYNSFANRGGYNLINFNTMGLFLNRLI